MGEPAGKLPTGILSAPPRRQEGVVDVSTSIDRACGIETPHSSRRQNKAHPLHLPWIKMSDFAQFTNPLQVKYGASKLY